MNVYLSNVLVAVNRKVAINQKLTFSCETFPCGLNSPNIKYAATIYAMPSSLNMPPMVIFGRMVSAIPLKNCPGLWHLY